MTVPGSLKVSRLITKLGFQNGDLVTARVKSILPNGRYRLILNRHTVIARSNLVFEEGQRIRARFVRGSRGIYLHLLESKPELVYRGFTNASAGTMLSAALIRAGLPLPGEIEGARRAALLERTRGARKRMARLYAELLAKGADPNAKFLEMLNRSFSEGGNKRQGRWSTPPEGSQLSDELRNSDIDDDPLLNLLTYDSRKNGGWSFVRLKKFLGDREIRMMWKIRRGIDPALALTIQDGKRIFEFLMEGFNKIRMTVFSDSREEIKLGTWYSFRETLASLDIEVDDSILALSESDGFTPENFTLAGSLEAN